MGTVMGMVIGRQWAKPEWVGQLMGLTLKVSLQAIKADGGGVALWVGDHTFLSLTAYSEGQVTPMLLRLPDSLLQALTQSPITLSFPETLWLPAHRPYGQVLLCGAGERQQLFSLVWVGRHRSSPFCHEDQSTLERLAEGIYHLLLPVVPFYQEAAVLRAWLEMSLASDIPEKLERSLAFLLELLVQIAQSKDGAVILADREGVPKVGVACGEGEKWLTVSSLRLTPFPVGWMVRLVTDPQWVGLLAVRHPRRGRSEVHQTLSLLAQAFQTLVQWSHQTAWLDQLIWRDPLTQLLNRRAFLFRLEGEMHRATRYGYPVSVLFVDLDGFKPINDLLGHPIGDKVLQKVGQTLQASVRRYDLVGRYGGDEFVLALPATPLEGALVVAERLRTRIAELTVEEMQSLRLSLGASIGVTVANPSSPSSVSEIIERADQAAGLAKVKGRNRIEVLLPDQTVQTVSAAPTLSRDLWAGLLQYLSHSINNPVGGILGLTQVALQDQTLPSDLRETLKQIEQLALRVRDFSHRLARQPVGQLLQEIETFERRRQLPSAVAADSHRAR
jgi:diguanylate cyclase (GGDEF)-like protein